MLLVEDDPVNQKIGLAMLRQSGIRVDVAVNGVEALAALRHRDYDLVFMDCQMPQMDGFTATEAIRAAENGRRIPIVALTAHATVEDRDRCLAVGMDDYLTKPVPRQVLLATLNRWIPDRI